MPVSVVTKKNIICGLNELSIKEGNTIFLHSSLKSFSYVKGGAETVIAAFLEKLGKNGTLSVPAFSDFFWGTPEQIWDRQKTPSKMGIISETLRLRPDAKRSPHAPHSISAVGRLAEDLTERHNQSDFSRDSSFARLIELDAAIVMAGVTFDRCTLFHLFEEKFQVPYRKWKNFSGTVIDNGIENFKTFPFYMHYIPGVENDFTVCEEQMLEAGLIKTVFVGSCKVMMARAQNINDFIESHIKKDPYYLTTKRSRKIVEKFNCIRKLTPANSLKS